MEGTNSKGKRNDMKKIFIIVLLIMFGFNKAYANKYDDLYEKIDA